MNEFTETALMKEIQELNENLKMQNKGSLSARGAANYLSVGYDTVLRLTRIGELEHVRNGSSYIYKKEWLDSWLEKKKRRANQ